MTLSADLPDPGSATTVDDRIRGRAAQTVRRHAIDDVEAAELLAMLDLPPGRTAVMTSGAEIAVSLGEGPSGVAYNPAYLLDALGALESDVARMGFASVDDMGLAAHKPSILTGKLGDENEIPDYRYLLMPIRLHG